jgi:hypothetical protein
MASDLTWRTREMVQGHTRRWRVEGWVQAWKSPAGSSQWTKPPGEQGARRRVILRLLGEHGLCCHPDQHAQRTPHLPAYPVGSRRTHGQVACLINVLEHWRSSSAPQGPPPHVTHAWHDMLVCGRSTNQMSQRHWGRLEPTPSVPYRAEEVMRHIPVLST